MSSRYATLLVCDECLFSLNGKAFLQGVYTGDISITAEGSQIPQLMFVFMIEGDLSDPPQSLALEIMLPGEQPRRQNIPISPQQFTRSPDRTKWYFKIPVPVYMPILRVGRIEAKAIFDKSELNIMGPWIVVGSRNG